MAMEDPKKKLPYPLLIVDDRSDVIQALSRFFQLDFEHVLCAQTRTEAEALLLAWQPPFLLCDYWLGDDRAPSTEFLPRWRQEYPCLKRVVLMTGTKSSSIPPCSAIDDIFPKPLRLAQLVDYFRLHSLSL
jgi:CheY-like chemotaxis protein